MEHAGGLLIKLTATTFLAIFVIAALYVWVLPQMFPGARTYSIFVVGITGAGLVGAYYGYQAARAAESLTVKIGTVLAAGLGVTVVVALLSLFIILNLRGS